MAVAFDAKATTVTAVHVIAATQTKTDMTIGGTGTGLVVTIALATSGISTTLSTCSGVTWNGVSMTQIATKLESDSVVSIYVFGIAGMATGNHNIVASFTGGTLANNDVYIGAASFSGTDTTTANAFPTANALTDASTPSGVVYPTTAFSVTTVNGDAVYSSMNSQTDTFASMNVGTALDNSSSVDGNYNAGYRLATTTATTIQHGGGGTSAPCVGIAIRIQQPQSAATLSAQIML